MKLNVKRTLLVGLAFFSICAFWQMYDFTIPLVLKNYYRMGDTWAGVVMAMDNVLALFMLPLFGALSDRCGSRLGRRMPFILIGTAAAVLLTALLPAVIARNSLPLFLVTLGLLLFAMCTYRSPAVALMPDVTPKPLRSKGNALINLTGAVGGLITLGLVRVAVTTVTHPVTGEPVSDYRWLYWSVAAIMAVSVLILYLTVPERKLAMENDASGEKGQPEDAAPQAETALSPAARRSLILILCSVFLWFMGYNAVTTAVSKYAIATWGVAEGTAALYVMLASGVAILSYVPVGIVSSRLGRKRVIQFGVVLLALCFGAIGLAQTKTPLMYVFFAGVGVAWAAINVNSFPMVVELATGSNTGKFTGYYYTFSMAAQVLTPILSGYLLEHVGYHTLFPYAALMVLGSLVTISLVRHGDNKPEARHGLEALDVDM